jgi:hypothetical protein
MSFTRLVIDGHGLDDAGDGDDVRGSHDVAQVRHQLRVDRPDKVIKILNVE